MSPPTTHQPAENELIAVVSPSDFADYIGTATARAVRTATLLKRASAAADQVEG
ncbi:MAG: hypothetical protein Q7V09_20835 [Hydrogenophaga sp.]|uniref:hypothetical protein n=1 Tax=Hydrogenophaga sp. TaxID=1904254 RepID=UPI002723BF2D|nr:hypothetical protein [Hydrogenophaga sp.]MDO9032881.1 hypothetical protein [Hydrogenophaga sp.]